jgi:hypothetical protein
VKKLLMAFVIASVLAAILRVLVGQRGAANAPSGSSAGSDNGSHRHRDKHLAGADVAEAIDEAIEVSARDLSSAPTGEDAVQGAENN